MNHVTYEEVINSSHSNFWLDAMEDEMKSMMTNVVRDFVKLLEYNRLIGCKWVYKTKKYFNDQVEMYKPSLVAKRFS